jgi:hypothetical protein
MDCLIASQKYVAIINYYYIMHINYPSSGLSINSRLFLGWCHGKAEAHIYFWAGQWQFLIRKAASIPIMHL